MATRPRIRFSDREIEVLLAIIGYMAAGDVDGTPLDGNNGEPFTIEEQQEESRRLCRDMHSASKKLATMLAMRSLPKARV